MNWRKLATCRDVNTEVFFPTNESDYSEVEPYCKTLCDDCLVKNLCLQDCVDVYIMDRRNRVEWAEQFGYRAGMTGPERQQYVKEAYARANAH